MVYHRVLVTIALQQGKVNLLLGRIAHSPFCPVLPLLRGRSEPLSQSGAGQCGCDPANVNTRTMIQFELVPQVPIGCRSANLQALTSPLGSCCSLRSSAQGWRGSKTVRKAWAGVIISRGAWSRIFCPPIKNVPPIFLKVADMSKNRQEGNPLCQGLSLQGMALWLAGSVLLAGTSFATPSPRQPLAFIFPECT